ncbi:MAG: two-component regulator propeller domain-containing protein [Bacteroidota bacterium]|nr:two-component regulator propeller domain-containing protein [Bacteroidota bacterium]
MHAGRILRITLFVFSFLHFVLHAENQPTIERITSNEGLSHNTIRNIIQDKTGFIWLGTMNGVDRYDGNRIKSLRPEAGNLNSLSSGKIMSLYQDSRGYIWVRTNSDIFLCYNPRLERFISLFDNKVASSVSYSFLYEDRQKNIWLGSKESGCIRFTFSENEISSRKFSSTEKSRHLPSDNVLDIFEDSRHHTWILTENGLAMLENGRIKIVRRNGVQHQYIKAFEQNNCVFFATKDGKIDHYNLQDGRFSNETSLPANSSVIKTTAIGNDYILLGTVNQGLYLYNTRNRRMTTDQAIFGEKILNNPIFQSDESGGVWISNFSGNAWSINAKGEKGAKLNLMPTSILQQIDYERYHFLEDRHGNTWITTYGNGLFCYNKTSGKLTHYLYDKKNSNTISSNYLLTIAIDKNENIWVGTNQKGLNKLSFANRSVQIIYPDAETTVENGNMVRAFLEDNARNIWIATKAGSLYQYNSSLSQKKVIIQSGVNVYGMMQDNSGSVWLATKGKGIMELKQGNPANPITYRHSANARSLSNDQVYSILKDRKGRLWAATLGNGICVKTTPQVTEGFRTFFSTGNLIRFTRHLMFDHQGDIWVATNDGALRFNPDALIRNPKAYKHYTFDRKDKNSLSNPQVRFIFQDSKGGIWLATAGGGVNKFMGESPDGNGSFKVYSTNKWMANDNIMAIQEDQRGNLWISTENGIHRLNPQTGLFQNYNFSDDFSTNIFSEAACLTCRDGRMLWGSLDGFYAFYPQKLRENEPKQNKVTLTGFFIYDESAKVAEPGAPLQQSITYAKKAVLKADDKVFHIEFANLNFKKPNANQYMYILENYEKRWNIAGNYNVATYRNVPPGKYLFKVKTANSEGNWDEQVTTLEIVIKPPFWLSTWAFILYLLLAGVIGYFTYKVVIKIHRLNNAVKLERQLTEYKLRFFTNISHEFRTPLTLIRSSVDTLNELRTKMAEPMQHLVDGLDKNTTHLMRLIDQLLEFRKLQNNKQKLNLQRTDAITFLKEIFISFSDVAARMNIEYEFLPSESSIPIYLDKNKVDKIVFNLLSNAFKFTPRGGKITLTADSNPETQMLTISVLDNGIGIPKEKQHLLFSRFMQINFSASGTGIGLSLVNEFSRLHKGKASFNENEGGGAIFTVELPLNEKLYDKEDFVIQQIWISKENRKEAVDLSEFIANEDDSLQNIVPNTPSAETKYKVLIIDDNDDIRNLLYDKLSPHFEVITAEDGNVGIKRSTEEDPDLILCDVMMPGMNGFELTRKLKENFETCHIPVILLTAYISDEYNSEGIEAGADAYITKPFSMNHLMLQINKLLEKREKLRKHFAGNTPTPENTKETFEIPDLDGQFLKRIELLVDQNMDNPNFSVDVFAQKANLGRTLFYKKIKYLTGYSPNEFIRKRKMKKAAELLITKQYNVSEVACMVGIDDQFYFSKCFKAEFGCPPSRFPEDYNPEK